MFKVEVGGPVFRFRIDFCAFPRKGFALSSFFRLMEEEEEEERV